MIPPRKHHQEENTDSWLMSYADMITLLLCFFVIFVSVSEPKKEKLSAVTEGLLGKFGAIEMATPFQGVFRSLQQVVENRQVLKDIAIEKGEKSLSMEVSTMSFYKDKTADFDPEKEPIILELVQTLKSLDYLDYRISIEGYTSDVAINNPMYPSNWELSAARAARMVRFFIDNGIKADRMRATGFGDTRPKVPNVDKHGNAIIENRHQNERVVIRIEQVL